MGGATFPTILLLNRQLDRYSGITTLALPSGQSGNGYEHDEIPFCLTLKENFVEDKDGIAQQDILLKQLFASSLASATEEVLVWFHFEILFTLYHIARQSVINNNKKCKHSLIYSYIFIYALLTRLPLRLITVSQGQIVPYIKIDLVYKNLFLFNIFTQKHIQGLLLLVSPDSGKVVQVFPQNWSSYT